VFDQGIEALVFGDDVKIALRVALLLVADQLRQDQIRRVLPRAFGFDQFHLPGTFEQDEVGSYSFAALVRRYFR
jgi:hypothetical protein